MKYLETNKIIVRICISSLEATAVDVILTLHVAFNYLSRFCDPYSMLVAKVTRVEIQTHVNEEHNINAFIEKI